MKRLACPTAILSLGIGVGPLLLQADMIHGMTSGSTAGPEFGMDDLNTVVTSNIQALRSSVILAYAIDHSSFNPNDNFVFAGLGAAADVHNLDPGSFTVNQYAPWVVNNYTPQNGNPGANYLVGPDGNNYAGEIQNADAGGTNFVLSYQPQFKDDPTKVNFIQAYSESENGGPFTPGTIDSPSNTGMPYYNDGALAGSGTMLQSGMGNSQVPLSSSSTQAAWMIDIPFVCEDGGPTLFDPDCTNGRDETITSYSILFDTFIESTQTLSGLDCMDGQPGCYNIMYGGVEWGYTYTTEDPPAPEPSSIFLLITAFTAAGLFRYRRRLTLCPARCLSTTRDARLSPDRR